MLHHGSHIGKEEKRGKVAQKRRTEGLRQGHKEGGREEEGVCKFKTQQQQQQLLKCQQPRPSRRRARRERRETEGKRERKRRSSDSAQGKM